MTCADCCDRCDRASCACSCHAGASKDAPAFQTETAQTIALRKKFALMLARRIVDPAHGLTELSDAYDILHTHLGAMLYEYERIIRSADYAATRARDAARKNRYQK